jgi:hypothetical protein
VKRILITGNGKSGSWRIRGEQLGAAIEATIVPHARPARPMDLGIIVKRLDPRTIEAMRAQHIPIIWDIVDAWPQPHGNLWDRGACLRWLKSQIELLKPYALVAATRAMAEDIAEVGFKRPVLALAHHARPAQQINPVRRVVETVGYEGGVQYLGMWQAILESECARRGWRFATKPAALADLDIVVALREAGGYAAKHWKSNVKLANAQGSGTPIVCNREAGYLETDNSAATWADTKAELRDAFDTLADASVRHHVSAELRTAAPSLEAVAAIYRIWLEGLWL